LSTGTGQVCSSESDSSNNAMATVLPSHGAQVEASVVTLGSW